MHWLVFSTLVTVNPGELSVDIVFINIVFINIE